jgi:hypothetical protein
MTSSSAPATGGNCGRGLGVAPSGGAALGERDVQLGQQLVAADEGVEGPRQTPDRDRTGVRHGPNDGGRVVDDRAVLGVNLNDVFADRDLTADHRPRQVGVDLRRRRLGVPRTTPPAEHSAARPLVADGYGFQPVSFPSRS